jgi:hypothetical protein
MRMVELVDVAVKLTDRSDQSLPAVNRSSSTPLTLMAPMSSVLTLMRVATASVSV